MPEEKQPGQIAATFHRLFWVDFSRSWKTEIGQKQSTDVAPLDV